MKKFITTKENPFLASGLLIDFSDARFADIELCIDKDIEYPYQVKLKHKCAWLEKGWLKEVEKKEFTKSDMVDLIGLVFKYDYDPKQKNHEFIYEEYLRQR